MSVEFDARFPKMPELHPLLNKFVETHGGTELYAGEKSNMLFAYGCLRGVSVRPEGEQFHIRVNYFASEMDFKLVGALIRFLLDRGATVLHEGSKSITHEDTVAQWLAKEIMTDCALFEMLLMKKKEEYVNIPAWDVPLTLWRSEYEELQGSPSALHEFLIPKVWRLLHSRRAETLRLNGSSTLTTWSFDDMMTDQTDLVAVPDLPSEDFLFLTWENFLTLPGLLHETMPSGSDDIYHFMGGVSEDAIPELLTMITDLAKPLESLI